MILVLLAISGVAAAVGFVINGRAERPELVLAAVVLVVLAALLWRVPRALRIAKIGLMTIGIAAVHGRLFWGLYRGYVEGDLESKLAPLGPWVILLSGLAIVLSRDRGGTLFAGILWAATTAAIVAFLAANPWPISDRLRLELVNQFVLAHLAFLAVMAFWARLRTQLHSSRDEMALLSSLARTDALTEVGNRRSGEELLARMVEHCLARGVPLGVVLFDLDHFKSINDRHGHPAGDEVIRKAARLTEQVLRPWDYICRWGGEEFLVVAQGADLEMATRVGERLRAAFEKERFVPADRVTISVGVAALTPADDVASLIGRADAALYRAKLAGRNCVRVGTLKAPAIPDRVDAEAPPAL